MKDEKYGIELHTFNDWQSIEPDDTINIAFFIDPEYGGVMGLDQVKKPKQEEKKREEEKHDSPTSTYVSLIELVKYYQALENSNEELIEEPINEEDKGKRR